MFSPEHHLLGLELATHGFAGRQFAVASLARHARDAGVSSVLTDVLVSENEPEPARYRAFARIAAALSRHPVRPAARPGADPAATTSANPTATAPATATAA